jgi:putative toxin-antitoxin system antitoxin component (TIGR02293 family)
MNTMQRDIRYIEKSVNSSFPVLLKKINKGLDYELSPKLMGLLGMEPEEMTRHLGISMRTLHERKKARRFNKHESEHLVRLGHLYLKAFKVFDDPEFAGEWMRTRVPELGGITPMESASTEIGAREVEMLLGAIAHGVIG